MSASGINNHSTNLGLHTNFFLRCIPNRCPVAEHATCKEVWYHQLAARKHLITCSNTLRNIFFLKREQKFDLYHFSCVHWGCILCL